MLPVAARHDLVLQPRAPGHLHLRPQPEQLRTPQLLHAPEVQRVAFPETDRIAPAQAHADAADDAVREAADPPQDVGVRPAGPAPKALDLREDTLR